MDEPKFDPNRLKKKKRNQKKEKELAHPSPSNFPEGNNKSLISNEEAKVEKIYFTEDEKNALKDHHDKEGLQKQPKPKDIYSYDQMLSMLYGNLNEKDTVKKAKLPLPSIQTDGFGRGIKTCVSNYRSICYELHRDEQHLLLYLNVEIICKKKISENGMLTLMGRYTQNEFLKVVRNYIVEFVDCKTCGGRHTRLIKENGIQFVLCMENRCGGKRSVARLKTV